MKDTKLIAILLAAGLAFWVFHSSDKQQTIEQQLNQCTNNFSGYKEGVKDVR